LLQIYLFVLTIDYLIVGNQAFATFTRTLLLDWQALMVDIGNFVFGKVLGKRVKLYDAIPLQQKHYSTLHTGNIRTCIVALRSELKTGRFAKIVLRCTNFADSAQTYAASDQLFAFVYGHIEHTASLFPAIEKLFHGVDDTTAVLTHIWPTLSSQQEPLMFNTVNMADKYTAWVNSAPSLAVLQARWSRKKHDILTALE
jgi:hypothetical protein